MATVGWIGRNDTKAETWLRNLLESDKLQDRDGDILMNGVEIFGPVIRLLAS